MTPVPPPDRPPGPFAEPLTRDTAFLGGLCLLVVFAALSARGSTLAGVVPALVGGLGLASGIAALPVAFVFLLVFFLAAPFGFPTGPPPVADAALRGQFRVADLVLAGAAVGYLACQYRVISLTRQAMPADGPLGRPEPTRRPGATVAPGEFARLILGVGGCAFAGQLVWHGLTTLAVDPRARFPIRPAPPASGRDWMVGNQLFNRLVLLGGLLTAGGLAARFAFWYWRLNRLSRDEARMLLLDTGWREARRELNRQEKWRAWGRGTLDTAPADEPRRRSPAAAAGAWVLLIAAVAFLVRQLLR